VVVRRSEVLFFVLFWLLVVVAVDMIPGMKDFFFLGFRCGFVMCFFSRWLGVFEEGCGWGWYHYMRCARLVREWLRRAALSAIG
jgi:hypothetical protein